MRDFLSDLRSERIVEDTTVPGAESPRNQRSRAHRSGFTGRFAVKVLADVMVLPLGVGLSLSKYVAECEKVFGEMGLKTQLHANGTNVEGEWDDVFRAVKRCHERLHAMGVPRLSTSIKLGTRTDRDQSLEDKVRSVAAKI
jgi:uncharacterized protein (TIGR00106 family)